MAALRPYQTSNRDACLAALQRGENPLYVLPTGGGKTVTAVGIILELIAAGRSVCVIVHRRELLRQMVSHLRAHGLAPDVIAPGHTLTGKAVVVASIDTLAARADDPAIRRWMAFVDVVIPDEAHHTVAPTWVRVCARFARAQFLGLTATPFRLDGKGLGRQVGGLFSEAIRGPSIAELIVGGYLVEPVVYQPDVPLDLSRLGKSYGDYAKGQVAERVMTDAMMAAALRWYTKHLPGRRVAAFGVTVEHARALAEAFSGAGWHATSVDGSMGIEERDEAFAALGATGVRRIVQILTSCELVSEGVDIPVISGALLARPTLSTALYLQQVGRALRPAPRKDKAVIIDLVGNVATHGLPDDEREWSLNGGLRRVERVTPATRRCPTCARVTRRADHQDACPCGHRWPRPQPQPVAQGAPRLSRGARQAPGANKLPDALMVGKPRIGPLTAMQARDLPLTTVLAHVTSRQELHFLREYRGYELGWVDRVAKAKGLGRVA
jgi:superfamily II DNA or RNA helicase